MKGVVRALPAVAAAIAEGRAVVALESSVLAQGLPIPSNRTAARSMLEAVESRGAVAAITAVVRGVPAARAHRRGARALPRARRHREGLRARSTARHGARRRWRNDRRRRDRARAASRASMCFATGGIGGVHRAPPYDESADLRRARAHADHRRLLRCQGDSRPARDGRAARLARRHGARLSNERAAGILRRGERDSGSAGG